MPFTRGILYPLFVHWYSDTQSRTTIGIDLLEEGSVNHDPAVDRFLNRVSILIHEKGRAIAVAMVEASQSYKLLTVLDKVSCDPVDISMILKRKSLKDIDMLCLLEFWNFELDQGFAQLLTVKVNITAL
jgi:hypothetical protein